MHKTNFDSSNLKEYLKPIVSTIPIRITFKIIGFVDEKIKPLLALQLRLLFFLCPMALRFGTRGTYP